MLLAEFGPWAIFEHQRRELVSLVCSHHCKINSTSILPFSQSCISPEAARDCHARAVIQTYEDLGMAPRRFPVLNDSLCRQGQCAADLVISMTMGGKSIGSIESLTADHMKAVLLQVKSRTSGALSRWAYLSEDQ